MKLGAFLLVVLLVACAQVPIVPVEPTPPTATCSDVCARGAELGCEFARPTDGGVGCVDVCENVQRSGIIEWDLACRASAPSCDAVDLCEAP